MMKIAMELGLDHLERKLTTRMLVDYDLKTKLMVYDLKNNNKMLMTAYKKNIDMYDEEEEEEEEKFSHPNQSEEEDEDYMPDLM